MTGEDFKPFCALLDDIWALKGQTLTAGAKMVFFRTLEDYPLREVEAGLWAHTRDAKQGQFLPMPANVIANIAGIVADDGRPGAEEAWAMVTGARDERVTVVWTEEMSEAYGLCAPLVASGDDVGARMAFKESYLRLLKEARDARKRILWTVSLGHDSEGRGKVIEAAVKLGRLPSDMLATKAIGLDQLLALPAPKDATPETLAAREKAMQRLTQLREEFAERAQRLGNYEAEREALNAAKAEVDKKVQAYIAEKGEQ